MHFLHIAFRLQFTVREYITNVTRNNRLISPKKLNKLHLRQPDILAIHSHFDLPARPFINRNIRHTGCTLFISAG